MDIETLEANIRQAQKLVGFDNELILQHMDKVKELKKLVDEGVELENITVVDETEN